MLTVYLNAVKFFPQIRPIFTLFTGFEDVFTFNHRRKGESVDVEVLLLAGQAQRISEAETFSEALHNLKRFPGPGHT
jgi:hypothetical protein